MSVTTKKDLRSVLGLYGIEGPHLRIVKDTVGVVNETYFVSDRRKKWVLRKSSALTTPAHVQLEQRLIAYLHKNGFTLAPHIIPNMAGENITYFKGSLFALQKYLSGQIVGSWDSVSRFTNARAVSFFTMVAQFSKVVKNFKYQNQTYNHSLWWHVRSGKKEFDRRFNNMPVSVGKKMLSKNKKELLLVFNKIKKEFIKSRYDSLPKQVVHFDWHLGNVRFKGDKIVGAFDYDWVQFDSRLTDLASSIGMSCYYYGGPRGGQFKKTLVTHALKIYRSAYGRSRFGVVEENEYIKVALRGFILFQIMWAMDYYSAKPDRIRFKALNHYVKALLKNDFDEIFS